MTTYDDVERAVTFANETDFDTEADMNQAERDAWRTYAMFLEERIDSTEPWGAEEYEKAKALIAKELK